MTISARLKTFLDDNKVHYTLMTHSPAYTAQAAAATLHIPGKELAKTVVLRAAVMSLVFASGPAAAQEESGQAPQYDEASFKGMKWRLMGPYRGGPALDVAGVPSDPNVYSFGAVAGGR